MQANCVTVYMDDVGVFGGKGKLYYQYNDPKTGEQYLFRSSEVMHFKTWYSLNGIMGNLCGKFCKIPWVEHWKVRIL